MRQQIIGQLCVLDFWRRSGSSSNRLPIFGRNSFSGFLCKMRTV